MTDPRVTEALERAAERVATMRKMYDAKYSARIEQIDALEGWAEAVEALENMNHIKRNDMKCAGCEAIAKFITAMLGGGHD